jgi:hypothetical protein
MFWLPHIPLITIDRTLFLITFFGDLECVGQSFAFVAYFVFLRDWTMRGAVAGRRASNLATHLPDWTLIYLQIERYLFLIEEPFLWINQLSSLIAGARWAELWRHTHHLQHGYLLTRGQVSCDMVYPSNKKRLYVFVWKSRKFVCKCVELYGF